ncbi:FtsK/SpoIIIE domain-containing protein [Streptosporangium sandarakinum]
MTGTRALTAAAAIASALVDVAAGSTAHRRLYLRAHLSVLPAAVFAELEASLTREVTVGGETQRRLAAAPAGNALLIPYIVDDEQPGPNRGRRGYAGTLRTDFAAYAVAKSPHVLLVLDEYPFETVLTAAENAADLPQLQWGRLIERIAQGASGPAAQVVTAVADDLAGIPEALREGALLDEFAAFAASDWPSPEKAGLALAGLSPYLADPQPTMARLQQSREWRQWLQTWTRPDRDLAAELVRYAGERTPGVKKILAARGVSGLDWHSFTLCDLPARPDKSKAALVLPAQLYGVRSFLPNGNSAAAWIGLGDESLAVRFVGNPKGLATSARVRWGGREAEKEKLLVDEAELVVHLKVPDVGTEGWQFGRLELRRGQHLDLAVFRGEGTWFPVERTLALDQLAEAFIAPDPASVAAVGRDGIVLGSARLEDELTNSDPGERVTVTAVYAGTQRRIPLLADSDPEAMLPPEEGEGAGEGDGLGLDDDLDDGNTSNDSSVEGLISQGAAATGAHALLTFASNRSRSGVPVEAELLRFVGGDAPGFSGGGINQSLEKQNLSRGLDGLVLEATILQQPAVLAFAVSREDSSPRLVPDHSLESLSLRSLDNTIVERFLEARAAFFAALREHGSVHALLCGTAQAEARAYVDAYQELLFSIPVPGRYEPEYDRLLLCDLVTDPVTGQCWLAPTNPATVAWALELAHTAAHWAHQGAQLAPRDLNALTPAFLLPLLHHAQTWWEADPRSPRLWRRYRPLGSSVALGGGDPRTITRRLEKFLAVFDDYKDPRQRLAVALHEPGDGGSTADALRAFYAAERLPGAEQVRPGLDVTVYAGDGRVPEQLAKLVASDNDADVDKLVRGRISLTCVPSDQEPVFAHLSFVFRSPAQREPRSADLGERAPTTWVGGLATAPGRTARIGANEKAFASGLFVAPSNGPLGPLLARTLELVGGQPRGRLAPDATQVTTTVVEPGVMDAIYAASVWTTHADRLLGPEAFAPAPGRAPSIVDFDDRSSYWQSGLDSITVTERVEPYRTALTRAFAPAAKLEHGALPGLIDLGNAVSGRWNLDLLSLPVNKVRERVGILAAVAALRDLDDAFTPAEAVGDLGGVLLSLEELFQLLRASGVTRPSPRLCDDLIYLRISDSGDGRIQLRGRLIEVKYASEGRPDLGIARSEIEVTRAWLDEVYNCPTPARLFRSRDLAEFIRTGAARNTSFGLPGLTPDTVEKIAATVAVGEFDLVLSFAAADGHLHGDVISLELESPMMAHRQRLPGDSAAPMGYIRLGRPALQRLAHGEALLRPQGWERVTFPPLPYMPSQAAAPEPKDDGPAFGADGLAPNAAAHGTADTAAEPSATAAASHDTSEELAHELVAKASELDEAAAKYELNLAPFDTAVAQVGPSVIRYRTRLLGKQTIAGVRSKALDLGREIGVAEGVLVDQEPYYLTIDVPRRKRVVVPLADSLYKLHNVDDPGALPFLLGVAPSGEVRVADLARLPHLLVAGATGSGKSVLLRGLLCCLSRIRSPHQLKIMIIDPKQVDFMPFEDLPHLADGRIVTDPAEAIAVLADTLEREVAWRRAKLKKARATSALEFYEMGHPLEELPQMVILVDEFADLAASLERRDRQSFMNLIQRFGQLTRAFGIYLVLATQRPSVQVITGDIKANLTARVALKVQSAVDSTTILGRGGAEALRDRGDLLFDHGGATERLQAFYTTLEDVRSATLLWSSGAS